MQRILIVDDNEDIREVLGTYVAKEGFEPVVAKDGFEALDLFHKTNPSVILLDVMMPGMDGYKVCEKIREESDVPIILITAKGEDYERVMGLDIGADDYVVKPFNGNEVMARVRAVLRRMGRSGATEEKKVLNISDLTINIEAYTVYVGAEKLPMTKKEVEEKEKEEEEEWEGERKKEGCPSASLFPRCSKFFWLLIIYYCICCPS